VDLVDRNGLSALTMRRLGSELDVEAMSLYKHVANKDEILDGLVERVVGEMDLPRLGDDWKDGMRVRARSARDVLRRHSWAIGLLESRGSSARSSQHYANSVLGSLRSAGFSIDSAVHAFWLLDSYVYGHVIQEVSTTLSTQSDDSAAGDSGFEETSVDDYPYLQEAQEHALQNEFSFDSQFEVGLDLILDALDRIKAATD
jgi:AcrR family transcriptional regulator